MKKRIRILAILMAALMLSMSLSACSKATKDDVVGTWAGAWKYEGKTIGVGFVLKSNGQYTKSVLTNGKVTSTTTGTWELDGNKVILHNKDKSMTEYKYKGGKLYNADHEFTKSK